VQSPCKQPGELERAGRIGVKERERILDHVEGRRLERPDRRRVRPRKQHRHLTEEGTGLRDGRDLHVTFDDLNRARGKHVQDSTG